jgi:hypothetical protein
MRETITPPVPGVFSYFDESVNGSSPARPAQGPDSS